MKGITNFIKNFIITLLLIYIWYIKVPDGWYYKGIKQAVFVVSLSMLISFYFTIIEYSIKEKSN